MLSGEPGKWKKPGRAIATMIWFSLFSFSSLSKKTPKMLNVDDGKGNEIVPWFFSVIDSVLWVGE